MRTRRGLLVSAATYLVFALALALAGVYQFRAGESEHASSEHPTTVPHARAMATIAPLESPPVSSGVIRFVDSVLPTTSPEQRVALADYVVTAEEFSQAAAATAACLDSVGWQTTLYAGERLRPATLNAEPPQDFSEIDPEKKSLLSVLAESCHATLYKDVFVAYSMQQEADEANRSKVQELYDHVETCLASRQGSAERPPWFVAVPYSMFRPLRLPGDWLDHYYGCASKAWEATGLRPPLPVSLEQFTCLNNAVSRFDQLACVEDSIN